MKVAVLFFGEIRGTPEAWKDIYEKIVAPNHADVFMHHVYYHHDVYQHLSPEGKKVFDFYYLQGNKGVHYSPPKELLEIFRPKKILLDARPNYSSPELPDIMKKLKRDSADVDNTSYEQVKVLYHTIRNQSDSRKKVVELKNQYETDNHLQYDAIIMTRLDVALLEPVCIHVPLEHLYAKVYFYANNCPSYCVPQIREQILVGNGKSMNVIAAFHDAAPNLYLELCNHDSHFRQNEHFMAQHIHRCGIEVIDFQFPINYFAKESINGIKRFETHFIE